MACKSIRIDVHLRNSNKDSKEYRQKASRNIHYNLSPTSHYEEQLALSTYNLKPLKTSADPNELRLLGMRNVPLVPFFVLRAGVTFSSKG